MLDSSETHLALLFSLEGIAQTTVFWDDPESPLKSDSLYQYIKLVVADDQDQDFPIGHFSISASTGSKAGRKIVGRYARESAKPSERNETISITTSWVDECNNNHSQCRLRQPIPREARLVYIGDKGLKVVENPTTDSYVALSYSWGGGNKKTLQIRIKNRKSLLENFKESKLSRSHKEAIRVSRELGYKYIWIDALCIVQDDDDDWEKQSLLVPEIYGNADLTLMAGRSWDSRNGFLQPTYVPEAEPAQLCYQPSNSQEQDQCYISMERNNEQGPTNKRAWCFQEEFVSRRTLVYGEQQLSFRCREHHVFEDGGVKVMEKVDDEDSLSRVGERDLPSTNVLSSILGTPSAQVNTYGEILRCWYLTTEEYSTRSLFDPTDNHAALFGVVLRFQKALGRVLKLDPTKVRYIAGLWERDMANGLLWTTNPAFSGPPERKKAGGGVETVRRAPSWSWMALNGPIYQKDINGWQGETRTGRVDTEVQCCTPVSSISWSPTPGAWGPSMISFWKFPTELKLEINAYIREVRISNYKVSDCQHSYRSVLKQTETLVLASESKVLLEPAEDPPLQRIVQAWGMDDQIIDRSIAAIGQFDVEASARPSRIWAMRVTTHLGLLLEQTSKPGQQPRAFTRLGIFAIMGKNAFYPRGSITPNTFRPSWSKVDEARIPSEYIVLV